MVALVAVLAIRHAQKQPSPIPQPSRTAVPPATEPPLPTATASPSPTATELPEQTSDWVVVEVVEPTVTPWPTLPPPPPRPTRRQPSPTPSVTDCVDVRWSARQVFVPSAQVMVEIRAGNRCNRDLEPLDLWFEISGWRDGGLVQSVRGHPFERIRRGSTGIVAIGLPGSIDWYDEVTVEIVE
jgi:hypothetical protein